MKTSSALLIMALLCACGHGISFQKGTFKVTHIEHGEKKQRVRLSTDADSVSKVAQPEGFTMDTKDSIAVQLSFVDESENAAVVRQAFLRFENKRTGQDNIYLLEKKGRDMKVELPIQKEIRGDLEFWKHKDSYKVDVIMGDVKLEGDGIWTITEDMMFFEDSEKAFKKAPGGVFDFDVGVKKTLLPEFITPIAPAEKRAPKLFVLVALLAVLMPLPILLVAWARLGVFPLRISEGFSLGSVIGFELCLLCHVMALGMFWFSWNIVKTWKVMGVLMIPTYLFGRKVLSDV